LRSLISQYDSYLHSRSLVAQSGDGQNEGSGEGNFQQLNVGFEDEDPGMLNDMSHALNFLKVDQSESVDLGSFLKRPVKIAKIDWVEGANLNADFEPWKLYFSNAAIKRKLDNYAFVRCNLHVKVVINASPFYYGMGMVSYRPLTVFNPSPAIGGTGLENIEFMGRSQRPRFFLYPQCNSGGSMILPFLYHKNWLDATSSTDLEEMGTLSIDSIGTLLNANSVSGQTCTVQVYAWAEDLELAGPTVKLSVQSGKGKSGASDEYGKGAVSKPASAIARATGLLGNVPVIGPFMTATSYAADAVSNIASLFGFTNVPVIEDVNSMKNQPFPRLAATDIGTPVEKLTLDAKNELSIDPRICGCSNEDDLNISTICARESYLDDFSWAATDEEDALLWNTGVTPRLFRYSTVSSRNYYQATPAGMVSEMFGYWRGDIIFRFKIIASQYHRGRLKFSWDPIGDIGNTAESTVEVYTKIVDIAEESDVEFRIPYTQATSYLPIGGATWDEEFSTSPITAGTAWNNGILTVRVLTEQTSPIASAPINIFAFVKCADNIAFASPNDITNNLSVYSPQSGGPMNYDSPTCYDIGVGKSEIDPNIDLVHMGETVVSLRQYMRRSFYMTTLQNSASTGNEFGSQRFTFRRLPLLSGFDPNGINTANEVVDVGTAPFNYVSNNPITWISQCFVGNRGAIVWHCNIEGPDLTSHFAVSRRPGATLTTAGYSAIVAAGTLTANQMAYRGVIHLARGSGGTALTNQRTQSGVSVHVPMYSRFKFLSNDHLSRTLGSADDATTNDCVQVDAIYTATSLPDLTVNGLTLYCSAGVDYHPVFFLNVPTLYHVSTYPTPA